MSYEYIEKLAGIRAKARDALATRLAEVEEELNTIRRAHRRSLRALAGRLATADAELTEAVKADKHLFNKPRTKVFHDTKVGFRKGAGRVKYHDKKKTVQLIQKHLLNRYDELVKTEPVPIDSEIKKLPGKMMARIGASITGTGDQVVISDVATELDELIGSWLEDLREDDTDEEAVA